MDGFTHKPLVFETQSILRSQATQRVFACNRMNLPVQYHGTTQVDEVVSRPEYEQGLMGVNRALGL